MKKKLKKNIVLFKLNSDLKDINIEFIYKDVIYSLYPSMILAYPKLFDKYQMKIRKALEQQLGVKYSRYWGKFD